MRTAAAASVLLSVLLPVLLSVLLSVLLRALVGALVEASCRHEVGVRRLDSCGLAGRQSLWGR